MKVKELKIRLESFNDDLDVNINTFHPLMLDPKRFGREFPDGFEIADVHFVEPNGIFGPEVWLILGKEFKY